MNKFFKIIGATAFAMATSYGIAMADVEDDYFTWCESNYHQNVGCPKHGQVAIPAKVLIENVTRHIMWCESIFHQNVGCPNHGLVEVPPEVLAQEEAEHRAWCESIGNRNVTCR